MKNSLFITKYGKLYSSGGTVTFIDQDGNKRIVPVYNLDSIFCIGSVSITSGIIKLIVRNGLKIHFLTKNGTYQGTLANQPLLEGEVIINQVKLFTDERYKVHYAMEKLKSMKSAFLTLLKEYDAKDKFEKIEKIKIIRSSTNNMLGIEASMWRVAYEFLKENLEHFEFLQREYYPPRGEINAMISFINALIYSETLSLVREVGLLPEISFLHSSKEKRFSLVLDIADMFKPFLTLKLILNLDKENKITKFDFEEANYGTYLNETGRLTVVKEFRDALNNTFYFPKLKRNISFKKLIKTEIENIKSSISERREYKSFKKWELCLQS